MLFLDRERADDATKRAAETDFGFLDRCAWPTAQRVREYLDQCVARYPQAERAELVARVRSGDDRAFRSGLFELLLHEYLIRQGFLLTPHPTLPNGATTKPDFLVVAPDGSSFYLEATSASDRDDRSQAGEALVATTLQHLSEASHPNFFVEVSHTGYPTTQPSGRRLTAAVVAWLNTLNADEAVAALERHEFDQLPVMEWGHEDLLVTVTALPCRPDARGNPRRLIGAQNFGAHWVDGWTPIRDAVMTKARRYGDLELPLVIAVNIGAHRLDVIDEMQALYGQEQFILDRNNIDAGPRMERAPNGAWNGPSGPRSRRCSGAWLFHDVTPYTVSRRKHTLYANPCSYHELPANLLKLVPSAIVVDGRIVRAEVETMGRVLELSQEWPE